MKFIILIGVVALAATTFTPLAHASAALGGLDKQCYNTLRKEWSGCNKGGGSNAKLPDFKFNMKSHSKPGGNDNGGNGSGNGGNNGNGAGNNNGGNNGNGNGNGGNGNGGGCQGAGGGNCGIGNGGGGGNGTGNEGNGNGPGNNGNQPGNNTSPPQLNSNDIRGFDPSTGLYGPGT